MIKKEFERITSRKVIYGPFGNEEIIEESSGAGVNSETHEQRYIVNSLPVNGKYQVKVENDGQAKETALTEQELKGYGLSPGKTVTKRVSGVSVQTGEVSEIERIMKEAEKMMAEFSKASEENEGNRENLRKKLFEGK